MTGVRRTHDTFECTQIDEIRALKHEQNSQTTNIALIQQGQVNQRKILREIHVAIVGNGKPGLKDEVTEIKGGLKAFKWIYGALISLIGIIIAIFR
ncbi:MAG: hypothetical protein D4S01_10995 [Dehalococcoidia bacterium]|nr:MAG: hypothetical protein D4S01_10995 [Dehalococcoidia bacterium]